MVAGGRKNEIGVIIVAAMVKKQQQNVTLAAVEWAQDKEHKKLCRRIVVPVSPMTGEVKTMRLQI